MKKEYLKIIKATFCDKKRVLIVFLLVLVVSLVIGIAGIMA